MEAAKEQVDQVEMDPVVVRSNQIVEAANELSPYIEFGMLGKVESILDRFWPYMGVLEVTTDEEVEIIQEPTEEHEIKTCTRE